MTGIAANSTGNTGESPTPPRASMIASSASVVARARGKAQTSSRDCSRWAAEEAWRRRAAGEVIPATGITTPKKRMNPVGSPCSRGRTTTTTTMVMATR
jgi:hypothetical protein